MIAIIQRSDGKRMVACSGPALIAALAVMAGGCGNPGEGTVHVDPEVRAKYGKHPGMAPADYAKNKIEPIGAKSPSRKTAKTK